MKMRSWYKPWHEDHTRCFDHIWHSMVMLKISCCLLYVSWSRELLWLCFVFSWHVDLCFVENIVSHCHCLPTRFAEGPGALRDAVPCCGDESAQTLGGVKTKWGTKVGRRINKMAMGQEIDHCKSQKMGTFFLLPKGSTIEFSVFPVVDLRPNIFFAFLVFVFFGGPCNKSI